MGMCQTMDQETPLLVDQSQNVQQDDPPRKKTPLPRRKLSLLLLLRGSEPVTLQVIATFLPQVRVSHCTSLTWRTRSSSLLLS
ncbi:hypothetical protein V8E55_005877 [Tylopilus felleus]